MDFHAAKRAEADSNRKLPSNHTFDGCFALNRQRRLRVAWKNLFVAQRKLHKRNR
jgi:hypothetical protein